MHNRRDIVGAAVPPQPPPLPQTAQQQRRNQIKIKLSGFHCKQISLHLIITDAAWEHWTARTAKEEEG